MATITGTNGSDLRIGTTGNDTISGGNGNDILFGGNGNDLISGGNGCDLLFGGDGADTLYGQNGDDLIEGGAGNDTITGDNGNDLLHGNAGDDLISGGHGTDVVVYSGQLSDYRFERLADGSVRVTDTRAGAWDGTDTVREVEYFLFADGLVRAEDLPEAEPNDTADYSHTTQGVTVDLVAGTATGPEIGTETLVGIVNVIGGSGDDVIVGDAGANTLSGGAGNDFLAGGPGDDWLDGGTGLDRAGYQQAGAAIAVQLAAGIVTVGASTDTLRGIELVRGGSFNDSYDATGFDGSSPNAGSDGSFNEFEGMGGDDTIVGNGNTRISYLNAAAGVNVNLGAGTAAGLAAGDLAGIGTDTFTGVNAARGSEFGDELRGSAGNDTLLGGGGDDFLGGGPGADTLNGGDGIDTVGYGMAGAGVTVALNIGATSGSTSGGGGNDTLISIENVTGSAFDDDITGNGAANVLSGNDGVDILRGGGGDDTLNGGNGNDILVGGAGNDTLNGGAGIDRAVFAGMRSAYSFGPGTVSGPDGADSTNSVELLRFDDAFMLGFGLTPINLTGYGLEGGVSLFGRAVDDLLTMGTNANGRLIDLGDGNDSLTLGTADAGYSLNLAGVETLIGSFGHENVYMASAVTNNMMVDLSFGIDTLNLGGSGNVVTVKNVETVLAYGGTDVVTFVHDDFSAGQSFNLGFGDGDMLILTGGDSSFSFEIGGDLTVVGATSGGDETVDVVNAQGGSTFDLGAGTDSLQLNSTGSGNLVTVRNVEFVEAIGFGADSITIAGNAGGVTTVTAAGGADMIWASADEDHFRFTNFGDSPYDVPFGGQRDLVVGFDASQDTFVFDGIGGPGFAWDVIEFGGANIVRIDLDGDVNDFGDADATNDIGWDMAIQVDALQGILSNANFSVI